MPNGISIPPELYSKSIGGSRLERRRSSRPAGCAFWEEPMTVKIAAFEARSSAAGDARAHKT